MATIQSSIELEDHFSNILNNIINAVDSSISAIEQMQNTMNAPIDTSSLAAAREEINQATAAVDDLIASAENIDVSSGTKSFEQLEQEAQRTENQIQNDTNGQEEFNQKIQQGAGYANNLSSNIAKAATAFLSIATVKKVWNLVSDSLESYNTQLNAETQLMTVLANMMDSDVVSDYTIEVGADTTGAIDEIDNISGSADDVIIGVDVQEKALNKEFDQILDKASEIQSSGIYGDEAMVAGAAELATYFSDVEAIEMMMDTLSNYAAGMSGGGEVDAQSMVDYATNLGKIMSGSYDAMTKKGFEFTDVQEAIIEGTATEAEIVDTLGEEYLDMSEDMQAAAAITQIIDESWAGLYDTMSNTPEGKIIALTNRFGDLKEVIGNQLYPYVIQFVDVITGSWGTIESVVGGFIGALQTIMNILAALLNVVFNVGSAIVNNWSTIAPIVYGIVAALAAYEAVSIAVAVVNGIHAASEAAKAAAAAMATGATFAETAAQYGLNAALMACPMTWIIAMIIAMIAVLFVVANRIANVTDVANTGFGIITGGVNVVIQFFKNLGLTAANIAIGIGNAIAALGNNIQVAFQTAIANVQTWFFNLLSTALSVIESICAALNKLPFVQFDYSGITSAADSYAAKAAAVSSSAGSYESIADAFSSGYSTYDAFSDGWASDAFSAGSSWGDNAMSSLKSALNGNLSTDTTDYSSLLSDMSVVDGITDSGLGGSAADTASNTKDLLDCNEEELKYMRDIAEQETINRYTTAEITIDQTNNNNISNSMDLDGVVDGLTNAVNEAIEIVTEGVHT